MRKTIALICLLGLAGLAQADDAKPITNWWQFRGPDSMNNAPDNPNLPETWSTTENVAWKTEIPGRGWSSPVVWGDKIFFTSVVNDAEVEAPKKGLYMGGNRTDPQKGIHHWVCYALDLKTGKKIWEKEVKKGEPDFARHLKNSYASETPTTDGERVYFYFGNVGLFVFDMNGNEVWKKSWDVLDTRYGWGMASSPVLYKGKLYIVNDNDKHSFVTALDAKTGKEIWTTDRLDEHSNWSTPYIWENELRTELVTAGTDKVRSYDLDGKLLWELKGMSTITIANPFSKFGLVFISSGYVGDNKSRPIYAIKPGAKGDVTLKPGEKSNEFIVWSDPMGAPYNPTPVVYGDIYYVLYDRGIFSAYDAKTGKEVYGKQRIDPAGTAFTASPWAYNGKIFLLSEDGDTFIVQAGPEYKVIGKNSLNEMCMSTPAIVGDNLILRTAGAVYCIRKGGTTISK